MTPYERLMAEAIPTGTFGDGHPDKHPKPHTEPWTVQEQAQHLRTLNAALEGWKDPSDQAERDRDRYWHRPPRLRLVHPGQRPAA